MSTEVKKYGSLPSERLNHLIPIVRQKKKTLPKLDQICLEQWDKQIQLSKTVRVFEVIRHDIRHGRGHGTYAQRNI